MTLHSQLSTLTFMETLLQSLAGNYTLRMVALGSGTLGLISGALGTYAVLRRQSLLGDAISHAALPGVMLAFMLTRTKTPLVLVIGAALAGWVATLIIMAILRTTRIKYDTALGLVMSVFFGLGITLLTAIQGDPDASQAGLKGFLFGQAAATLASDIFVMAIPGGVALLVVLLFWKEFKLLAFDADFGASLGYRMRTFDILLTTMLVIAIVIGLQTVGAVLMASMLVAPAAAARQWTDRLGWMMGLAALFGAVGGVGGAFLSNPSLHQGHGIPPGPAIVLCVSALVGVSMLFAPNRGLLWSSIRHWQTRRQLQVEAVLCDLYELSLQHEEERGHPVAVLQAMSAGEGGVFRSLRVLEEEGLARRTPAHDWLLTAAGREQAQRVLDSRGGDHG